MDSNCLLWIECMTKKQKIIALFNCVEWIESPSGETTKIITYEHFRNAGLRSTIEYGEKYSDVVYARRIIQSMGHRVIVGTAFNVWKDKLKQVTPHNAGAGQ